MSARPNDLDFKFDPEPSALHSLKNNKKHAIKDLKFIITQDCPPRWRSQASCKNFGAASSRTGDLPLENFRLGLNISFLNFVVTFQQSRLWQRVRPS
jgi:hypothetical protein